MKLYTAIFNTEILHGVHYAYEAENTDDAIITASEKLGAFPNIAILEDNGGEWSAEGILVYLNGHKVINVNGGGYEKP